MKIVTKKPLCESCNDTKEILVTVGDGVLIDDQLRFARVPRPCPECTDVGRAWEEVHQAEILAEYEAELEQAACALCRGTGTVRYPWSISAASKGLSIVPCPECQPKPIDPWRHLD